MRQHLRRVRESGALDEFPGVDQALSLALQSGEQEWIPTIFNLLQTQEDMFGIGGEQQEEKTAIFQEPNPSQCRGDIHLGCTIPSRHEIFAPLECFGNQGQEGVYGGIGSGKSTLLNYQAVQLIQKGIPVTIYDVLDQCSKPLLSVVPKEKLGVVAFRDYQRNNCNGPKGFNPLTWIEAVEDHLSEGLELEGPSFDSLVEIAEDIDGEQQVVCFRNMLRKLQQKKRRSPTEGTVYRRLKALRTKAPGLLVEEGFDLDKFCSRSMILELKQASSRLRTLTYGDHFGWFNHSAPTLNRWELRRVLMFHESTVLLSRGGGDDSWRKNIIRRSRTPPQRQHPGRARRRSPGPRCRAGTQSRPPGHGD